VAVLSIEAGEGGVTASIARDAPVLWRGAAILALLTAPPRRANDETTLLAQRRWCRVLVDTASQDDGDWGARVQHGAAADMAWPLQDAQRALPGFISKVNRRLATAHAIRRHLAAADAPVAPEGQRHRRVPSIVREALLTVQDDAALRERLETAGLAASRDLPEDVDNFKTRVLRESLPVVHIAFAYAQIHGVTQQHLRGQPPDVRARHGMDLPELSDTYVFQGMLGSLLTSGEFQDALLAKAEALEALLPRMRKPRVGHVVRVRLVDAEIRAPAILPFVPLERIRYDAAPGDTTEVVLPGDAPDQQVAMTLLAVLAAAPRRGADTEWARRLRAFYRLSWQDQMRAAPDLAEFIQPVVPDHLTMPLPEASKLVAASVDIVGQRLLAAETLLPSLRHIAGHPGSGMGEGATLRSLAGEIRRVLAKEQGRRLANPARLGGPSRSREVTGERAVENFRTRVLEPARPVIHLAAGFAFALEMLEREAGSAAWRLPNAPPHGRVARFDWWRFCHHEPRFARVALDVAAGARGSGEPVARRGTKLERDLSAPHRDDLIPSNFAASGDPIRGGSRVPVRSLCRTSPPVLTAATHPSPSSST
jgi:hypothetical protein